MRKVRSFDFFLDGYYAAGPAEYREVDGCMCCVQQYKKEHQQEYTIMQMKNGLPHGLAQLFENGLLRLQWTMENGKRVGDVTVYEEGLAVKRVNWNYFYSSEDERAIENQRAKEVMIITASESEVIVYRGGFDSAMNRDGFGIEYDRSTGEPLYSGVFVNDQLFQINQEFVSPSKMIEYQIETESNLKAVARHPIYVGEFKLDPITGVYQRHGKGREIDPKTGLAVREGDWCEGTPISKGFVKVIDGWYNREEPKKEQIPKEIPPLIEKKSQIATITNEFELNSMSREIKSLIITHNVDFFSGVTTLSLSSYPSLVEIHIGDSCFGSVSQFVITNNNKLETISIGMNCFTTKPHNWGKVDGRKCQFIHCASLKQLKIGEYSFSDYASCEFRDLPLLESIDIGSSSSSFCFSGADLVLTGE